MRHTTTNALFQHSLQTTDRWLTEVMAELAWTDRHKAYTALRATLQALRQRLPVDECAQLSAQLPLVLRGVYWEGWNPSCAKTAHAEFLASVHAAFKHDPDVDPRQVASAVFRVLAREISPGEFEHVRSAVSHELRRLMPEVTAEASEGGRNHRDAVTAGVGGVSAVHWGAC